MEGVGSPWSPHRCACAARVWMSVLSTVSCPRIAALESGVLAAGLAGSKRMAIRLVSLRVCGTAASSDHHPLRMRNVNWLRS